MRCLILSDSLPTLASIVLAEWYLTISPFGTDASLRTAEPADKASRNTADKAFCLNIRCHHGASCDGRAPANANSGHDGDVRSNPAVRLDANRTRTRCAADLLPAVHVKRVRRSGDAYAGADEDAVTDEDRGIVADLDTEKVVRALFVVPSRPRLCKVSRTAHIHGVRGDRRAATYSRLR